MNPSALAATRAETRYRTTSSRVVVRSCKVTPTPPTSRGGQAPWPATKSSKRSRQGHSAPPKVPVVTRSKKPCGAAAACVACGAADGPLATCTACSGAYHPRCFDPPRKTLPQEGGWMCFVCDPVHRSSGAAAGVATGAATGGAATGGATTGTTTCAATCEATDAVNPAAPYACRQASTDNGSVHLISSVLSRLSGEASDSERRPSSPPLSPTPTAIGACAAVNRRKARDSRGERAMNNVTDTVLAWALRRVGAGELGDNLNLATDEEEEEGPPASEMSVVGFPTCHCGNPDARKPSARCTACGSVCHLLCMDPPCVSKKNLPRSGYTCRACREKRRPSLSEEAPQAGWASAGGSGGGGGGFVVLGEAGGSRRSGGGRGRVGCGGGGGGGGEGKAGEGACAVCGVSEGKKNICGSCGDGYHSLCLDRPRTRRAGGSWLCDACRSSSPTPTPSPAHGVTGCGVDPAGLRTALAGTAANEPSEGDSGEPAVAGRAGGGGWTVQKKRPPELNSGYWLMDEHERFLKGFSKYGRDWHVVARVVRTRTPSQIKSHAQKVLLKGPAKVATKHGYARVINRFGTSSSSTPSPSS